MIDDYLPSIGKSIKLLGFDSTMVAGGSYSYKYDQILSFSEFRDIDLLLILANKDSVIHLLVDHQKELQSILRIEKPEFIFRERDLALLVENYVDAIRFSGINDLNQKISIKIVAYDFLQKIYSNNEAARINVLSKKDKRFYKKKSFDGKNIYVGVINQKLDSDLTILGDPDVFELRDNYSLGVISDLLLSGRVIHQTTKLDTRLLKEKLIYKITDLSDKKKVDLIWPNLFFRYDRFPGEFKTQLVDYFHSIIKDHQQNDYSRKTSEINLEIVSPLVRKANQPLFLIPNKNQKIRELRRITTSGPFSSNSNYGVAVLENDEKCFYKEMLNEFRFRGELYGLITISTYFNHLQKPILTQPEKNLIVYKWNHGDILARKRLESSSEEDFNLIMELELKKAEDHLNAYLHSTSDIVNHRIDRNNLYLSRIHDLYYGRLASDRLKKLYGNYSVTIGNQSCRLLNLLDFNLIINGVDYGSISKILSRATDNLNPKRLNQKPLVCGLGDAHMGNVMIPPSGDSYMYIDYEFAGFHSPYLDIAKALHNDCAFNVFYADKLMNQDSIINAKIKDHQLVIEHDYLPNKLSRFLLKTKIEGILLPMKKFLKSKNIKDDENWLEILGQALFCCGFLVRKPTDFGSQNNFLLNLANSVEMNSFDTYYQKVNRANLI